MEDNGKIKALMFGIVDERIKEAGHVDSGWTTL